MSNLIDVKGLIKIYGPRSADYLDLVKNGLDKADLSKRYGHVLGLMNVNISVPAGEVLVVMGLSGSGKSTLIRHLNRLIEPTEGAIPYDGKDITKLNRKELRDFRRNRTAMVFQSFALLPHRTVAENVAYGLELQGVSKHQRIIQAEYWIERVGLRGYSNQLPGQLSGGMRQRVGLARALASKADILLMDEAFSALDPLIRVEMQNILLQLQAELKKTIVFITHDLDEALKLGNKVVVMRDGMIIQEGTGPEIVLNPADDYIESFVREVNRGRVIAVKDVMEVPCSDTGTFALDERTNLQDALKAMTSASASTARIVGTDGHVVGAIDVSTIMSIMAG